MRFTATAMALATLATLTGAGWAAGCTGLSGDCTLNLTCPMEAASSAGSGSGSSSSGAGPDGGDGGVSCIDVFTAGACNTCLETSCCQSIIDCEDDAHCLYCLDSTIPDDPMCASTATQKVYNAFIGCEDLHCSSACVATDTCNPITNDGCGTDGTACDLGTVAGTFQCFKPPNNAQLCGVCDGVNGPYCAPGLHCYEGLCARYCCSDSDCGSGVCELDQEVDYGTTLAIVGDAAGICLTMLVPDGGAPDASSAAAACDAPLTSASKGSCVPGHPPM